MMENASDAGILIPQSPFDFAHGPEPVEGREKDLLFDISTT